MLRFITVLPCGGSKRKGLSCTNCRGLITARVRYRGSGNYFQLLLQSLTTQPQLKSQGGLKTLQCFRNKILDLGKADIDVGENRSHQRRVSAWKGDLKTWAELVEFSRTKSGSNFLLVNLKWVPHLKHLSPILE